VRWGQKTGGLCVWAICEEGRQVRLSLCTTNSESEESCRDVCRGVAKRGMPPPGTRTTAGAIGRTKAREARGPQSCRLRCWFPQRQHLQQPVPLAPRWPEGQAVLVDRRAAPPPEKAEKRRAAIVEQDQREVPEAWRCLLEDAAASLHHLAVPHRHQQDGRTSNLLERAVVEERRRTKVSPHLWGEQRLVNLVFGVWIRVRDRWGKQCFRALEQQQIRRLRETLKLDE
jgi:transposase-like protein